MNQHHRHIKALVTLVIIFGTLVSVDWLIQRAVIQIVPKQVLLQTLPNISRTEITHGDNSKQQVIFTFDGGGSATSADSILNTLAKHQVQGTFFLTGKFVERHPDIVKRMVASGHEIFNHTYDHPHLTTLSDAQIADELKKMEQILRNTAGVSPKSYFRAPYGDRNERVLDVAFREGYQSVYWSDDAKDWEESRGMTAAEVKNRILTHISPGEIYLMHLGDTITGAILDDVFSAIEARGYKIVSLTQGL